MSSLSRREMIKTLGLGAGVLASGSMWNRVFGDTAQGGGGNGKRPNIIVMMVDDMGYSDIGCYGGEIQTPNLDALASGGVRFTRFYNTARCCPSRASILSGLYPHQTGLGYFEGAPLGPIEEYPGYQNSMVRPHVNLGEVMRAAGYATGHIGKWHVSQTPYAFDFSAKIEGGYVKKYFDKKYGSTAYNTDWLGDKMVEFVTQSHQGGKPFFAYWAPFAPHWPIDAKVADMKKYEGVYEKGPRACAEARVAKMRELGILPKDMPWEPTGSIAKNSKQDQAWRARIMTDEEFLSGGDPARGRPATSLEEGMRGYAAQVDSMDQNVGKVVAKLKELGIFENTLILFCSDNGASNGGHWGTNYSAGDLFAQVSNTPFRYWKMASYDGGIATPLIVSWPAGIPKENQGSINHDTVGHLVDIMPTVMAASGARYPDQDSKKRQTPPLEGRNLLPAVSGKQVPLNQPVFIEHAGNCALITQDWKITANDGRNVGPWSLYDMKKDRCEITDVAAQHPEVVKELADQWAATAKRIGARHEGNYLPKTK